MTTKQIKRAIKREIKGIDRAMAKMHVYIVLVIAIITGHEIHDMGNVELGLILLTVSYVSLGYHVRSLVNSRIRRRRRAARC